MEIARQVSEPNSSQSICELFCIGSTEVSNERPESV